jgi:2-acylglycerol O-acyltransferase 2
MPTIQGEAACEAFLTPSHLTSGKATCDSLLRAGISLVVFPGGLDEANTLGTTAGDVRIKTRTGFVRLAVKHGVPVLPTFTFGELDAVEAVPLLPMAVTR